jgi:hypothetical protein
LRRRQFIRNNCQVLALGIPGHFVICAPDVSKEILERYQIEQQSIVRLHADLNSCVVMQESVANIFGGHGKKFRILSVLFPTRKSRKSTRKTAAENNRKRTTRLMIIL